MSVFNVATTRLKQTRSFTTARDLISSKTRREFWDSRANLIKVRAFLSSYHATSSKLRFIPPSSCLYQLTESAFYLKGSFPKTTTNLITGGAQNENFIALAFKDTVPFLFCVISYIRGLKVKVHKPATE